MKQINIIFSLHNKDMIEINSDTIKIKILGVKSFHTITTCMKKLKTDQIIYILVKNILIVNTYQF